MEPSTSITRPPGDSSSARPGSEPSSREIPHQELAELIARRDRGETLPRAETPLQLGGLRLSGADLSGLDLSGADLSGASFVGCILTGSRLVSANLSGAVLQDADLSDAELLQATMSGADLSNARLDRAGLGQVVAIDAVFFGVTCEGGTFTGADLTGSDLRAAKLSSCRARSVNLTGVDLTNASLIEVDLGQAILHDASFRDAKLDRSRFKGIVGYKRCDWINADIHDVDFTGAWLVRRFIQDENYLHEFRSQSARHEKLYRVWSITSDCGRSLSRWAAWTVLVALIYAAAYTQVDIDWGDYRTPLSPVYYSVVTFTTLGYGDVLPGSTTAQVLVISEVILGYFSLGGMMSILSDKMARRAG
ncbi:MAG: pentapeptide repeat-containing protein [Actinomycetota bacterium]